MSTHKLLADIEKKFGKGTLMFLNSQEVVDVEVIPTGIQPLDLALGVDGIPLGIVLEVFGEYASGKTTLTLQLIAQAQKKGITCAFIDVEHAFNPTYAMQLGVDLDKLLFSQPDSAETALEVVDSIIHSGDRCLIIVDSVAALSTRAEIDGEMSDVTVAGVARLMGKALRKMPHFCSVNNCTILFINQLREKIGGNPAFGVQKDTTGGKALKYQASLRIEVINTGQIKEGEGVIGNKVKFKIKKNKFAKPFVEAETTLIYGEGFSTEQDVSITALEKGIIVKEGNTYFFNGQKVAIGKAKLREAFEDEDFTQMVKDALNGE